MIAPVLSALIGCQPASFVPNPLLGIWRSTERRASPGKLVYVFHERHVMEVYDGECRRPVGYRYQATEGGRVQLLLLDPGPEQDAIMELELAGDEFRILMEGLGITPIFRRVQIDDVRDLPCIADHLAPRPPLDRKAAAALAAQLANDECERKYALRPFTPEDWPIVQHDGRWSWGDVDPLGPSGYSPVVTFEADGRLPLVRVYRVSDRLDQTRPDRFFIEEAQ